MESGCAVGVEYLRKGRKETLRVDREVILAGGAINSPQLLQLSGIGDGDHLRALGIKTVHELKGVGRNLSDHVAVEIQQMCVQPISLLNELRPLKIAKSLVRYVFTRKGPIAHP